MLSPLTLYILCALSLGGSLMLWVSFKKELQMVRSNAKNSYASLNVIVQTLSDSIDTIRQACRPGESVVSPRSFDRGFDSTSRAEVLRMQSRNEPASAIAAALRLPHTEVAFLLKIDALLNPGKA